MIDVIIKFVALAAIARFDDIYAAGLYDEKIKKAVGCALPTEFKRKMTFVKEDELERRN